MTLNKKPIAWHEEGHKHHKIYLQKLTDDLEYLQSKIKNSQDSYALTERQIAKAKAMNIIEYDADQAAFKRL